MINEQPGSHEEPPGLSRRHFMVQMLGGVSALAVNSLWLSTEVGTTYIICVPGDQAKMYSARFSRMVNAQLRSFGVSVRQVGVNPGDRYNSKRWLAALNNNVEGVLEQSQAESQPRPRILFVGVSKGGWLLASYASNPLQSLSRRADVGLAFVSTRNPFDQNFDPSRFGLNQDMAEFYRGLPVNLQQLRRFSERTPLIVHGVADTTIPPIEATNFAQIAGARLITKPGGHDIGASFIGQDLSLIELLTAVYSSGK